MSESNAQALPAAAAAALPFLIDRGLAEPCNKCPDVRKLAAQLAARPHKVAVRAEWVYPAQDGPRLDDVAIRGGLEVHCLVCHDTRIIPTEKGWKLIGFIRCFLEDASVENIGKMEEIPF